MVDNDLICSLYISGLSINQVAKKTGHGRHQVHNVLIRNGIQRRSRADGIRLSKNKHLVVSDELRDLLDGLLLSDGHYTPHGRSKSYGHGESAFIFRQAADHEGWVYDIQKRLLALDVPSTIRRTPARRFWHKVLNRYINAQESLTLRTSCFVEMSHERDRWYPLGFKQVPSDIRMNNIVLWGWYLGDGTNLRRCLRFSTDSFQESDVRLLAEKLNYEFRYRPRVVSCDVTYNNIIRRYWHLYIGIAEDLDDVHDRLRAIVPNCLAYKVEKKWPGRRIKPKRLWRVQVVKL